MSRREKIILLCILAVALVLRVAGAFDDLPFMYHPDEPGYVWISQTMFRNASPSTTFFNYPTLYFYINAAGYIPYYVTGLMTGDLGSRGDIVSPESLEMGVTRTEQPSSIIPGRVLSILFGTAAVFLLFQCARELTGSVNAGLAAALLMAVSPLNVTHSRFITPDVYVVFFSIASLLGAVRVFNRGRMRDYLLAGACIGFTASSKYNGVIVAVFLLAAHIFRHRGRSLAVPGLYVSAACAAGAFFLTSPYILLSFAEFRRDMQFEAEHYSSGHAGMEGNSLAWYLALMIRTGLLIYILGLAQVIRGLIRMDRRDILLASFPVIYFVFIAGFTVRNDRTLLPATPFFFLLAALLFTHLIGSVKSPGRKRAVALLGCLAVLQPLAVTAGRTAELLQTDCRETAGSWIAENVPEGSLIALEAYSPWVDPALFHVHGVRKAIDNDPEWYLHKGFQYLILSREMYGRYQDNRDMYPAEAERYDRLFETFPGIKQFRSSTGQIDILIVQ